MTGWSVTMVAGGPVELGGLQPYIYWGAVWWTSIGGPYCGAQVGQVDLQPYIYCEAIWCTLSRVDQDARLQVDQ